MPNDSAEHVRVIKQIRKKISDTGGNVFSNLGQYPIGIDGIYADMFSGLNLEEELRIGGEKDTIITEENDYTSTEVRYYLLSYNNNKPYYNHNIYYKLLTEQYKKVNRFLTDSLELDQTDPIEPTFLRDNNTGDFIVFQQPITNTKDKILKITLSIVKQNENIENVIKEKIITYNNSSDNTIEINEQIVWEQGE